MNVATVTELRYRFKEAEADALRGVSLEVRRGEVLGLIGPDGAGKTTLQRLMTGLLQPASGKVSVKGRIGYMSQKFSLYEDLSISENMRLFATLQGVPEQVQAVERTKLLAAAGLAPFESRFAGKLSGGMRQKLALICAMQGSPELMLLDEPGVGVDPVSRRELWQLVDQARGGGCGIVWATAYLDEAARCDRVCVLHEGQVLYLGSPNELLAPLRGRVFALTAGAIERLAVLRHLQSLPQVMDAMIEGSRVRFLLKATSTESLPEGAEPVEPNFEEAFINLIGGTTQKTGSVSATPVAEPSQESALRTVGLTKRFGSFVATNNLSIDVRRGEIFGILGANGAGKTTAFRMICGLLPASEGSAHLLDIDLLKNPRKARARIGYMAQKFSLYSSLTVLQNLRFFAAVYGLRGERKQERIEACIARFELSAHLRIKAGSLPMGQKQRLSMACATLHEPDFLFLDEPTSGVDPFARRAFWEVINELSASGVTIIVTTHFMDEAQYLHRMVIMNHGCVIAEGSPEELKARASSLSNPHPTMEDAFIHFIEQENLRV